jgi:hypothetical protein
MFNIAKKNIFNKKFLSIGRALSSQRSPIHTFSFLSPCHGVFYKNLREFKESNRGENEI